MAIRLSYDTETDILDDTLPVTVSVQCSEIGDVSPSQALVFEGTDCFKQFFEHLEKCEQNAEIHVFNLDYEFSRLWREYLFKEPITYKFSEQNPEIGEWSLIQDQSGIYSMTIHLHNDRMVQITDDARRFPGATMDQVATAIKELHPEWWGDIPTKTHVEYNDGWFRDTGGKGRIFREYARIDAFSQMRIYQYTIETGQAMSLTSASHGMSRSLAIMYGKGEPIPSWKARKAQRKAFMTDYPPLDAEMQEIAENSLLGGFVWGVPGLTKGTFTHLDYSSSYPAEYHHGRMFRGRVFRWKNPEQFNQLLHNDKLFCWVLVSFDFSCDDGVIPFSGGEIDWASSTLGKCPPRAYHSKIKAGRVEHRLYTASYFGLLPEMASISGVQIHEVWTAHANVGKMKDFIEICYGSKENSQGIIRDEWKRLMNAGVHGKTITKTKRRKAFYTDTGAREWRDEQSKPKFCFLIGFTAMMNGRERLLRDCLTLQRAGLTIYMCDTDSIVCNGSIEQVREILGDGKFSNGIKGDISNLGKFTIEREFNEFRCWGLKRYLELQNGEYQKSAFAGMRTQIQKDFLIEAPLDGSCFTWEQIGFNLDKYGKTPKMVTKTAKLEDVIYHEEIAHPKFEKGGVQRFLDIFGDLDYGS